MAGVPIGLIVLALAVAVSGCGGVRSGGTSLSLSDPLTGDLNGLAEHPVAARSAVGDVPD